MIQIFGDTISQPTRAVVSLCNIERERVGPSEFKWVDLFKGENKSKKFSSVLKFTKIPGFKEIRPGKADVELNESHAIMKYICYARSLPDHWYQRTVDTQE